MTPSKNCYNLVKEFEGLRLKSYLCSAGVPTIGYGSTMYKNGQRVKLGETITRMEAAALLQWEIDNKATVINSHTLKVRLNQNQFDALVSLAFNIGVGGFASSTLLKKLLINPNDPSIAFEFSRWNKAAGKTNNGLTVRRKKEANFYFL